MADERIADALRNASDTRAVVVEAGALAAVDRVLADCFGDTAAAVVVADETTMAVAGATVDERMRAAGRKVLEPVVLPAQPALYADYDNVTAVATALRGHDAVPVAVGSGTINDLVKRAAHECERAYLSVATAASMDGYTAFGAAITKDGYKRTMTCPAPRAVVGDLDVLTAAPAPMTASGYADLLGKVTAGADWIVADTLGTEAIEGPGWGLVQPGLRNAVGRPADLRAGDPEAMRALIDGLVMAGLAMQAQQSSRPASGAEHQFSHLWEMEGLGRDADPPLSHGFKVGLGTIAIAALYERLLARDLAEAAAAAAAAATPWPGPDDAERAVRAMHPDGRLADAAVAETLAKHASEADRAAHLDDLSERWPALRARLTEQLLPAAELRAMLRAAGCPTAPEEIGLRRADLRATYTRARTIRRRYTVLDLAHEAGVLEACVDELFAPGGFWA
jgi:glycerol-1-phosphate dehydrogenase [NAD(P)+]